jgi:ABC-type multidrug transport system fused ATPase/permease subunit
MSIIDTLERFIIEEEELQSEGIGDVVKGAVKLLPVFATMFQLLTAPIKANDDTVIPREDVKIALIDMQEAKTKAMFNDKATEVAKLISSIKAKVKRDQLNTEFEKAKKETIKNLEKKEKQSDI